jgi:hypothetical protein
MKNLKTLQIGLYLQLFSLLGSGVIVLLGMFAAITSNLYLIFAMAAPLALLTILLRWGNVVGTLLCLTVPSESGTRPAIIISVVFGIAAAVLGVMLPSESLLPGLCVLASFGVFLFFLSHLAQWLGRPDLSHQVSNIVACAIGAFAFAIGGPMLAAASQTFALAMLVMAIPFVFLLASVILYAVLLVRLALALGAPTSESTEQQVA